MEADSFSFAPRSLPKPDLTKRKRPVSQIVFTESLLSQARRKCMVWGILQARRIKLIQT